MIRLLLIRHGETEWNAEGRIQGHTDVELTDVGLAQARLAAERLRDEKIDVVYASDLRRASVTGAIIAALHGLEVVTTPLLREAFLGDWQGLTIEEVAAQFPEEYAAYRRDSVGNRPPGAERLEDVIDRCRRFLDEVMAAHPDSTLAIAAHGGSIRGLLAAALGQGPAVFRCIRLDNAGLTIMELDQGRPLLVTLNDTCHLAQPGIGSGADE